ncbi:MAG: putative metal-binding motif-containing protein [Myxococcota bacterium]
MSILAPLAGLWLGATPAVAQEDDCKKTYELWQFRAFLDQVDAEYRNVAFDNAWRLLEAGQQNIACVIQVVPTADLARFALQRAYGLELDLDDNEAKRWASLARTLDPGIEWPDYVPETHMARTLFDQIEDVDPIDLENKGLEVPPRGGAFLDGRWIDRPTAEPGLPHLFQVGDATGVLTVSEWIDGTAFPEDVLGPPPRVPLQVPRWYSPDGRIKKAGRAWKRGAPAGSSRRPASPSRAARCSRRPRWPTRPTRTGPTTACSTRWTGPSSARARRGAPRSCCSAWPSSGSSGGGEMPIGALWTALLGCPWITLAEHRDNQDAAFGDADADADADADSDADTDTDTETGLLACPDDPYEPSSPGAPAEVDPGEVDGVICPEDVAGTGEVIDAYRVTVGATDVLRVDVDGRAGTDCGALAVTTALLDPAGGVYPGAAVTGCGTIQSGWGSGPTTVQVTADPADAPLQYRLTVALDPCRDRDGDSWLDAVCGGPDCDDTDPDAYPGAPEVQDGVDQDCDGGDDLDPLGCVINTGVDFAFETLGCGDLATDAVWDAWSVPVLAGSTLSVLVDNDAASAADLVALVLDPDGTSHYGLAADRSQLDDEALCRAAAWSGGGCPEACVAASTEGDATIWVAQHPGSGCQGSASYQLLVYVDGLPASLTLAADDAAVPFPP